MTAVVHGERLRWYRGRSLQLPVAMAVVAAFSFVLGAWDFVGFWVGSAALLLSLLSLTQGFVAGIGVGADGVLVRRASGRSRWVPWAEVQRFDLRERDSSKAGHIYQICVVRKDGTLLSTGVWTSEPRARRSRYEAVHDLEDARLEASQRLGLPS